MKSKIQISFLTLVFVLTLAFAISSCGPKENQAPVITINEPMVNETVTMPDSVHVELIVTDDESLHEMSVLIIQSTGDTAFKSYPYVHELKTYTFHSHFHPLVAGSYTLKVTAADHDSKSSTVTRAFTVN